MKNIKDLEIKKQITNIIEKYCPEIRDIWEQDLFALKYCFGKKTAEEQSNMLKKFIGVYENGDFLDMVCDHITTLDGKTDEEIAQELAVLVGEEYQSSDSRIFTYAEAMIAGDVVNKDTSDKFKEISNYFYAKTHNHHYKLFADYSEIYSTTDIEELEQHIVKLREYLDYADSITDRNNFKYLICLCLQRLCLIKHKSPINIEQIDLEYGICFAKNFLNRKKAIERNSSIFYVDKQELYDEKWDNVLTFEQNSEHSVTIDFEKIIIHNCPAICRLFVTDYHYFSYALEDRLSKLCHKTKEMTRYNKMESPIISEKMSFCLFTV